MKQSSENTAVTLSLFGVEQSEETQGFAGKEPLFLRVPEKSTKESIGPSRVIQVEFHFAKQAIIP